MKKLILISFLIMAINAEGRIGWRHAHYSILGGQQLMKNSQPFNSITFMYDYSFISCTSKPKYYGYSVSYNFNKNQSELSIQGFWNLFKKFHHINKTTYLAPNLGCQINSLNTRSNEPKFNQNYSIRPSFALTGNIGYNSRIAIRTVVLVGYTIPLNYSNANMNNFVLEFKLGIGFNKKAISRMKKKRDSVQ